MSGNVAEWTSNAFDESAFSYAHDMNSDYHYNASEDDHPCLLYTSPSPRDRG